MNRIILTSLALSISAGAATADPEPLGAYGHHMWGWGGGFLGLGMMILFWGVIIAVVAVAYRWLSQNSLQGESGKPSALDVLRERFARGEIDIEDFEARRKALSDKP